jgi:hypothetical protein
LANKTQLKITSRGAPGLLVPAYLDRGCRYLTVHRYVPLQHERSTGQYLQDVVLHPFPGCPSPGTALQWPTLKQSAISWYCTSEAPLHVGYHHTTSQRRITSTANGIRQRQPDARWSVASPEERAMGNPGVSEPFDSAKNRNVPRTYIRDTRYYSTVPTRPLSSATAALYRTGLQYCYCTR